MSSAGPPADRGDGASSPLFDVADIHDAARRAWAEFTLADVPFHVAKSRVESSRDELDECLALIKVRARRTNVARGFM